MQYHWTNYESIQYDSTVQTYCKLQFQKTIKFKKKKKNENVSKASSGFKHRKADSTGIQRMSHRFSCCIVSVPIIALYVHVYSWKRGITGHFIHATLLTRQQISDVQCLSFIFSYNAKTGTNFLLRLSANIPIGICYLVYNYLG